MPISGPELIRKFKKWIADGLLCLLAIALLLWCADWAAWRIRVHHGTGYSSVQVTQLLLTPLKNHRVKADEQSIVDQPCARAIFPHGGQDPCWWLRRHATQWQSASLRQRTTERSIYFINLSVNGNQTLHRRPPGKNMSYVAKPGQEVVSQFLAS